MKRRTNLRAITEETQLQHMRLAILGDTEDTSLDDVFRMKLDEAKYEYLRLVYPYNPEIEELPNDRAKSWQTKCAVELYKINEDGPYSQYSENGLQWTKSRTGISSDLLNELPPARGGVPRNV